MHNEKRFLRKLKKELKRDGNRQRRRYLQNIDNDADGFSFGPRCSEAMNEATRSPKPRRRTYNRSDHKPPE